MAVVAIITQEIQVDNGFAGLAPRSCRNVGLFLVLCKSNRGVVFCQKVYTTIWTFHLMLKVWKRGMEQLT